MVGETSWLVLRPRVVQRCAVLSTLTLLDTWAPWIEPALEEEVGVTREVAERALPVGPRATLVLSGTVLDAVRVCPTLLVAVLDGLAVLLAVNKPACERTTAVLNAIEDVALRTGPRLRAAALVGLTVVLARRPRVGARVALVLGDAADAAERAVVTTRTTVEVGVALEDACRS